MPRFTLFVVLALSAAVLGCGFDPGGQPGPDRPVITTGPSPAALRLASARAATIASGTARTAFTASVSPASGAVTRVAGEGTVDFGTGRGVSTIHLSPLVPGGSSATPTLDTIFDGDVVYIRSPLLELLGIETPWLRIDRTSLPRAGIGTGLGDLSALPDTDQLAPLGFLAGVEAASVEVQGSEEIDGVATTHLRASVDLRSAATAAGAGDLGRSLTELDAGNLTVDAYLDHDDRLRRLVYDHPLPPALGGGWQRFQVEYFAFGTPVEIDLPALDEVTDLGAVVGGDR